MVMVSFQFPLVESGLESDGRNRRSYQDDGMQSAPCGPSFSVAGTICIFARDWVAKEAFERLNVAKRLNVVKKEAEERSAQLA
jgi:hypothetical protein